MLDKNNNILASLISKNFKKNISRDYLFIGYIYIYIYVCVCVCINFFQNFFPCCKCSIVWSWFIAKIIFILKNNSFKGIQNDSKSNRVPRARKEVCRQFFGGREVQIMCNL